MPSLSRLVAAPTACCPPVAAALVAACCVALAPSVAPAAVTAAVPWSLANEGIVPGETTAWVFDEILINGRFDTGTLFGWSEINARPAPAWTVIEGSAGAFPFGPADGSYFATPWTSGGWQSNTRSTLQQTRPLPPGLGVVYPAEALVRFEAVWSWDHVELALAWLDDSGAIIEWVDMGRYGYSEGRSAIGRFDFAQTMPIPAGAAGLTFRATGEITNGVWLDAGFDNASVMIAREVPIPEPAVALLAPAALLLRRRKR